MPTRLLRGKSEGQRIVVGISRAWVAVFGLTLACASTPPEVQAPAPVEAPPHVVTSLPSPSSCEILDESCTATPETRARIARTSATFTPMLGWLYAQGEAMTSVQSPDARSWLLVAGHTEAREAELERLIRTLEVSLPKAKIRWKQPDETMTVGTLRLQLWELQRASWTARPGSLLVFSTTLPDEKNVLGVAFVPDDDITGAGDQMLTAIRSILPDSSSSP